MELGEREEQRWLASPRSWKRRRTCRKDACWSTELQSDRWASVWFEAAPNQLKLLTEDLKVVVETMMLGERKTAIEQRKSSKKSEQPVPHPGLALQLPLEVLLEGQEQQQLMQHAI